MSRELHPYLCDGCGKRRDNDVNRWWIVSAWVVGPREEPARSYLQVDEWRDELAVDPNAKHACGQACAQKLVERWLTTGSLEEEKKGTAT